MPNRSERSGERRLMPVYRNPDFLRLPNGLARLFDTVAEDSFFALPAWYDLMARYGVPAGSEIRVYTDERPGSAMALLLRTDGRCLTSLANANAGSSVIDIRKARIIPHPAISPSSARPR